MRIQRVSNLDFGIWNFDIVTFSAMISEYVIQPVVRGRENRIKPGENHRLTSVTGNFLACPEAWHLLEAANSQT